MATHLRYSFYGAPNKHPQQDMKDLGITYFRATPQSIADQWWFWCCEGVPDTLPEYITKLDVDPMEMVGFGLDKAEARAISERSKSPPGGADA